MTEGPGAALQAGVAARSARERRDGARRAEVLRALRQSPEGASVRELAERLALHENTVRFHLGRLLEDGVAERRAGRASGPGRPRSTYAARGGSGRSPETEDPRNYELLARILAGFVADSAPDPRAAAVAAGEAWGRSRAARPAPHTGDREESVRQLVDLLQDVGFEPEPAPADPARAQEVRLRHCPFLEVAVDHPEVACSVHLGLMRGALEQMGAPVTAQRLQPFVRPSLCIAHLGEPGAT